jgi:diguanylate cyclase (GGDEF)-like protein/PAS domain S-box-containing protein
MLSLEEPVFRHVLDTLQVGVCVFDGARRILWWNNGAERISGYLRQDVVGRVCEESILLHADEQGTELCGSACPVWQTIQDGKKRESSVYLRHKAGHLVPVHVWCVAIHDDHGNIIGASQSFEEHHPDSGYEARYQELAAHGCLDAITGLPNQAFTLTRLREQLGRFSEHHLPFSILIIGLAADKTINATQGHSAAERMLQSAAKTLSKMFRPTDYLGRWAGDQLLAILVGDRAHSCLAQSRGKLLGLSRIHWWGDLVPISVVLAGAEPMVGDTLESLLSRAHAELTNCIPPSGPARNQPEPGKS